ncbi:MAG TPA: chemotaxis protein CheW [Gallionellaceae bacterium]
MEEPKVHRMEADWLPPVAALAYFEPPPGAHAVAAQYVRIEEKRARYGFRVGGLGLLIDPDAGSEVMAMPAMAVLPGAPPGFAGLINLRGNLAPLYDLRALLGLPQQAGAQPLALVLGQGDDAVGIIIEGHPIALTRLNALNDFPALPDTLAKYVPTGYTQDDTIWLEFDHHTFFGEICAGNNPPPSGIPEIT